MLCPVSLRAELGFCLHLSPLFNSDCLYTADNTDAKLSHRAWLHSSARRSSTSGVRSYPHLLHDQNLLGHSVDQKRGIYGVISGNKPQQGPVDIGLGL